MAPSAFEISKPCLTPHRKLLHLKNFSANLASDSASIIHKKQSVAILPPAEECAGKKNCDNSDFFQEIKLLQVEALPREELEATQQKKVRLWSDRERTLAAMKEMDAEFERWMKVSERRSVDLAEAEIEIRRIVRAQELRASCEISSPFTSLRTMEEKKGCQAARLQERLLQKDRLSDEPNASSNDGWLNNFKRIFRRRQLSKLLAVDRGVTIMSDAMVVRVGSGVGGRWRKATRGGNCDARMQRWHCVVPYYCF